VRLLYKGGASEHEKDRYRTFGRAQGGLAKGAGQACAPLDWSAASATIDGLIEEEGLVAWCGRRLLKAIGWT
jgi:hypothetical protein